MVNRLGIISKTLAGLVLAGEVFLVGCEEGNSPQKAEVNQAQSAVQENPYHFDSFGEFKTHILGGQVGDMFYLEDMDSDGDKDIIFRRYGQDNFTLEFYENRIPQQSRNTQYSAPSAPTQAEVNSSDAFSQKDL